jgi:hypothetical protein
MLPGGSQQIFNKTPLAEGIAAYESLIIDATHLKAYESSIFYPTLQHLPVIIIAVSFTLKDLGSL